MFKTIQTIPEGCKSLPLTNGGRAIIDAADFDLIKGYSFHFVYKSGRYYACCYPIPGGPRAYLHQLLMGEPPAPGLVIDHRNHSGLLNSRANLRWATARQNRLNHSRVGSCGFFGVTTTASGKYQAYALGRAWGSYGTREEAAMARDRVLRESLAPGDLPFVNFNFTPDGERIVIVRYDHRLPPRTPRVKSSPYHGISVTGRDKHGRPIFVANAMINGRKFKAMRHRDEIQGARHVDEIYQAHGLPRPNFPDVTPLVITLGISYGINS